MKVLFVFVVLITAFFVYKNINKSDKIKQEITQPSIENESITTENNLELSPKPTNNQNQSPSVISKIRAKDNGPLWQCSIDNKTYFLARGSAFDGSDNIYDINANLLAECGGGWGIRPDTYPSLCAQMETAACFEIK